MRFLRSNTAVIVTVGPFYDKTDGVTIETALTITNERITLTADTDAGSAPTNILDNITGATSATANDLNYITGNDAGLMQLELAAADVNRVGRMMLSITDAANHVPVFHEFTVLPQAIYDWLIAGSIVPLPANVTTWLGTAAATPTVAGVPEVDVTHFNGTAGTFASGRPEVNTSHAAGTAWGSGAITAGSIAADAITAAKVAADVSVEIAGAVWNEDATGHQTTGTFGQAIGDPVADTNTIYKAVVTDAAGATVGADVVAAKADTAAILVDTGTTLDARIPAALVSGRMDVSVGAMAANVLTAAAINADAITAAKVAADVSAEIADQVWDEVLSGHLTATTTGAALNGATAPTAAVVADAVWDEVLSGHLTATTTGNALNAAGAAGDPWTTAIPGAYGAGTAGKILGDNINATISSRASQTSVDTVDDLLDTELPALTTAVAAVQADTDNLQTRIPAALVSGRMDASVGAMAANVMTAAAAAADLTTELQAGLATAAALTVVDDFLDTEVAAILAAVDTEVAAIKAKTDQLTFTTANQVDAQAVSVAANAVTATALAASAATEIAAAVWDEDATAHQGSGTFGATVGDQGAIELSIWQAAGAIVADTDDLQTRLPAALVGGRMDSSVGAMTANVVTASALAADAVDELLDEAIGDGTLTMRQAMRVLVAGMAGKLSGAATTTITIRNAADSANVIVATVDADGNRSAVTVTP